MPFAERINGKTVYPMVAGVAHHDGNSVSTQLHVSSTAQSNRNINHCLVTPYSR